MEANAIRLQLTRQSKPRSRFDCWNSVNFTVILNSSLLTYMFSFKL